MSALSLYAQICSYENLKEAFLKARKGKTQRRDIIEFQKNLKYNLIQLQSNLILQTYSPKPLETFIISDPKTRKISKSDFQDRIVHHAVCNSIEPMFDKAFIYDSYANRVGNLTSQFFANVYLNELDQFVKHILRAKQYIRYVDDFVIFSNSKAELERHKRNISLFLRKRLFLELHPEKSKTLYLHRGVDFLGIKIFPHHKLIKKRNLRKFKRKLKTFISEYNEGFVDYDTIYDSVEGWQAYAKTANTYNLTKKILKHLEERCNGEISSKELNRYLKLFPKQQKRCT